MAYLRKNREIVEIAYSLNKVWLATQKALSLESIIEQIDEKTHHIKIKTKTSFMFLGSVLIIDMMPIDKNTTKVSVVAETPVTTITALVDFGQAKHRIDQFFTELMKQLTS